MHVPEVCVVYLLRTGATGGDEVLVGRKRRGLGLGKIVAPGGKLEPGESPVDAAVREVAEEVGLDLDVRALEGRGSIDYLFPHRPAWTQRSHVFVARSWAGEPAPSAELDAGWTSVDALDLGAMWDDARWWLPDVLRGGRVDATFTFGADLDTVSGSDHPRWLAGASAQNSSASPTPSAW